MPGWREMQIELLHLEKHRPRALRMYPDPRIDNHEAPFGIGLAADAEDVAAELHAKFGDLVELTVGALSYPARRTRGQRPNQDVEIVDPAVLRIELDGDLRIASGANARHHLLVTNLTEDLIRIVGTGYVESRIVDPSNGATIGGSTSPTHAIRVTFDVAAGATSRVPLLVGTESFDPDRGYAVPPGRWALVALPRLERDGQEDLLVRSELLPITIV